MSIEFLVTSMILVLIPGTGVLYTLAISLGGGFKHGLAAAMGCTLGIVPSAAASIIGLTAVFDTSALVFQLAKMLGVAYLLYMAWNIVRDGGAMDVDEDQASCVATTPRSEWHVVECTQSQTVIVLPGLSTAVR